MNQQPIRVSGERKDEPDLRRLARALIAIAARQAEAAAEEDVPAGPADVKSGQLLSGDKTEPQRRAAS